MLAEGDVLMRMPLAEFLRGCGYRVLEAKSADEAILFIEDDTFTPEIVVSNVELAGDGFGIANWIRNNRPDLTLILTGTPKRQPMWQRRFARMDRCLRPMIRRYCIADCCA
ncbi:response regulator [Bradyrhizobium sp. CCGUVB23]|uniref:response regulator n=1 Tax=Bradyrhizobium sp. CCGUVB23 TaxID=2949630 RepID=UPI0020B22986|nr:response regulator [Bradyrhizobium sp. CCGUVB23]MCP3466371.1 response regulator [Bradyrhizobium sp. CCGUVB23]